MTDLDAWFAKVDGILTDWPDHEATDAMHARPPTGEDKLPRRADSYYDQITYAVPNRAVAFGFSVLLVPPMLVAGVVVGTVRAVRRRG
jgi:hypothetical protein